MKHKWEYLSPSGGRGEETDDKLFLSGKPLSFGVYSNKFSIPGDWIRLDASCIYENLASPETAVTVMLSFYKENNEPIRRQYIEPVCDEKEKKLTFSRIFNVPELTSYCIVELALRWPGTGNVSFNEPVLSACSKPAERKARVFVTHFNNHVYDDKKGKLERIKSLVAGIKPNKPDLICFCEMLPGQEKEPIDGPFVKTLAQSASECNSYIIGNFMEDTGDEMFNTSVLLDRKGNLIGKYRKTHLPLIEVEMGVSPGDSYPVFDTDFGRIGMLICWDTVFQEAFMTMKKNGAELVISSTIGDFWPQDSVRARDNGTWFAIAGSHRLAPAPTPPSRIYDPTGSLVAATGDTATDTFTYADIDFNRCYYMHWASVGPCDGELPSLYKVERRPETYGK